MIIYVIDPDGDSEFIARTAEELETVLANTAADEFAETVLAWFNAGDTEPLKIQNGREIETWHVI